MKNWKVTGWDGLSFERVERRVVSFWASADMVYILDGLIGGLGVLWRGWEMGLL